MADVVVGASLQVNGGQAEESVKSFRSRLKEAKQELYNMTEQFGLASKEAAEAAKKVAHLKDEMGDAANLVANFNPDRKFMAFGTAIKGVTSGFETMIGLQALFGTQSEDLEKTLVKVQAAMALTNGINELMELKDGFKIVKSVAVDAFKGIKAAIGSTGIGAILLLVGALVTYWDDIKEAVSGVSGEMEDQAKAAKEEVAVQEEKLKHLNDQDNILKLQGKSEREILAIKKKQIDAAIQVEEINIQSQKTLRDAQIAAAKRNKDILSGILSFTTAPLQLIIDTVARVAKFFGKDWNFNVADKIAGLVFDPEKVASEGDKAIKESEDKLLQLKNQRDGFQLQINDIDRKAAEERNKIYFDQLDQMLEEEGKMMEKRFEERTKKAKEQAEKDKDLAIQLEQEKQDKMAAAMKSLNLNNNIFNGLSPEQMQEKNKLLYELTNSETQIKLDALQMEYDHKFALIQGNEEAELALKKWYSGKKKEIDDAEFENKRKLLEETGNVLNAASDLFGRETVVGKTLAVAAATIDTYSAISKTLKAYAGVPVPGFAIAQSIAMGITGFNNVRKILSVKVPGPSGGGSSPSISASLPTISPVLPQVQSTTLNQAQVNQIGNAAAGGVARAYVVTGDIQNATQLNNRIEKAATLG